MKKQVGILAVTYHNYGSILQSFALQEKVKEYGFKTEILNYSESKIAKIWRCRDSEYLYTRMKMLWKLLKIKVKGKDNIENLNIRNKAFNSFIKGNFAFSRHTNSLKDLRKMSLNYDMIILGSDQVWHPMNVYMNYFTMNFVPNEVIKAAYAPSFGVSEIPEKYLKFYHDYLFRINYLSCREKSGIKLIKDISGRNSLHVCDPTMLLSGKQWEELVLHPKYKNEKFIFCYLLGNNPKQRSLAKSLKELTELKIIALTHIDEYVKSDENYADEAPYNVGPIEFLDLIKHAEYVMTDSFHASVFSILFHTKFYVFNRFEETKGKSTTTRISSLLEVADLKDRFSRSDDSPTGLLNKKQIDWQNVDAKIDEFRKISIEYLEEILYNGNDK